VQDSDARDCRHFQLATVCIMCFLHLILSLMFPTVTMTQRYRHVGHDDLADITALKLVIKKFKYLPDMAVRFSAQGRSMSSIPVRG
jgi:hypothetical protein